MTTSVTVIVQGNKKCRVKAKVGEQTWIPPEGVLAEPHKLTTVAHIHSDQVAEISVQEEGEFLT
jgi:hypothetical protein